MATFEENASHTAGGNYVQAPQTIYHTVKPGETVSGIAAINGISEQGLRRVNAHLISGNAPIYPGMRLRVA
jgi:LysM repeat protein